jgi:hypothetical protein
VRITLRGKSFESSFGGDERLLSSKSQKPRPRFPCPRKSRNLVFELWLQVTWETRIATVSIFERLYRRRGARRAEGFEAVEACDLHQATTEA